MKSALLEIGTEPLPARFIPPALEGLEDSARELLKRENLAYTGLKCWGTPRRLAIRITGVPERSADVATEVQGPRADLWKDAQGSFTPQSAGFARAQGVQPQDLQVASTPRGEVLVARKTKPGEPALVALARIFGELPGKLQFPKSMEWEPSGFRFARPIRSLTALYGRKRVPVEVAGVRSGSRVQGHPSLGGRPVVVPDPERYEAVLKSRLVLADPEERRGALLKQLSAAGRQAGCRPDADPALVEETVFLTEHPVAVLGHFDRQYLELPKTLLAVCLKKQLKFFPLLDSSGNLAPCFVGVRDGVSEGQGEVQAGFERVLAARFADAQFFYRRDLQTGLAAMRDRLAARLFHKDLGTLLDKTRRVEALSSWLAQRAGQDLDLSESAVVQIAGFAYADLASEVVGEFPELQGAMGGVYARQGSRDPRQDPNQGSDPLDERVALGLEEFYYPVGSKSPIPTTLEGCLAALAGKLDTLAGDFAVGVVPTGSEDPHGLRRQALGVLRILMERQFPVSLTEALNQALELLPQALGLDRSRRAEVARALEEFLWNRAQAALEEMGYRVDEIRSVRVDGLSDLRRTFKRLAAVHAVRLHPDFGALAMAYKRAANILKQAKVDWSSEVSPSRALAEVHVLFLEEEEEKKLFEAVSIADGELKERLALEEFETVLRRLVQLKPALDQFFDKVLVMAERTELRRNRLSLLAALVRLFQSVADLSHIQTG